MVMAPVQLFRTPYYRTKGGAELDVIVPRRVLADLTEWVSGCCQQGMFIQVEIYTSAQNPDAGDITNSNSN